MNTEAQKQFLQERKEIQDDLVEMLKQTESDFVLQDILNIIFHEKETDDMMKIVAMFDTGAGMAELSYVLELVSDAWNHFPHNALGGKSPAEMRAE